MRPQTGQVDQASACNHLYLPIYKHLNHNYCSTTIVSIDELNKIEMRYMTDGGSLQLQFLFLIIEYMRSVLNSPPYGLVK